MRSSARSLTWLLPSLVLEAVALGGCLFQPAEAVTAPSYCAAYFEHIPTKSPKLFLFPIVSRALPLLATLPNGLASDFRLIEFSSDGQAIYGQTLHSWDGITKIEFKPARHGVLRGSVGIGTISSLVALQPSGRVRVSGVARVRNSVVCGVFEIDPNSAAFHQLYIGRFPDCGGAISPDGRRVLHSSRSEGNLLSILDVGTGTAQPIGPHLTAATWSPDGRWIAAIQGSSGATRVVLIDAMDISKRKDLGRTHDSQAQWSPDSKYLLVSKQDSQCGPYLWSLETIDVRTGKRTEVRSSHCKIFQNATGWMNLEAVR